MRWPQAHCCVALVFSVSLAHFTNHEESNMDKSEIGNTGAPVTMHIERGKIREFARAIKDDNPIYFDEEHARKTAGGIMAPPTFTMSRLPMNTLPVTVALIHGSTISRPILPPAA